MDDVKRAAAVRDPHFLGLIIGKALYDGRVDLRNALSLARSGRKR